MPEARERLETLGTLPSLATPAEFRAFVAAESDKFRGIIEQARIKDE
jgi:hypothetical protein